MTNTDWNPTLHSEFKVITERFCLRDTTHIPGQAMAIQRMERVINEILSTLVSEGSRSIQVKIRNDIHREDNPDGNILTLEWTGYR